MHQPQYPIGLNINSRKESNQAIIHYGFSDYEKIVNKYLTYKSYGQTGWDLDRLIDETASYTLEKLPKHIYPPENIPEDYKESIKPEPLTYDEVRQLNTWEEYMEWKKSQ